MPELVILAAGIGSRYGGLKQIDPIGPHNQTILDYSIYDAILAGFDRVVFVIRKEIDTAFRDFVGSRYEAHIPCTYTYQELDHLPSGFSATSKREKPWGTGHALWVCESVVDEPFAVINADDFYGRNAYEEMSQFFSQGEISTSEPHYGMVSFALSNTLSDHGSVSRGICTIGPEGILVSITERTKIERSDSQIRYLDEGNTWHPLTGEEPVSMNFWGFTPGIFSHLDDRFRAFLEKQQDDLKAEFFLPVAVDHLIHTDHARVTVLSSRDRWTGVTNPGDRPQVAHHLETLTQQGVYPERLWA